MLEAFYEVCEGNNDRFCWGNLASQYHLIFIAFHNTFLEKSILSIIFCGKSDKETDGLTPRQTKIQYSSGNFGGTLWSWFFVGENFENIWTSKVSA